MQTQQANTAQTSAQALNAIGQRKLKHLQDQIHDICLSAQRNGRGDISGKEIQARYELIYSKRIDASSISARVKGLIDAGRLERCPIARACQVTGRDIHPVRVPATQARLVG
jgi:hypothetical protein